jgi:CBS domain-containing protein
MTINISDMMSKNLELAEVMTSVMEAARKMREKNVSSLVVVDNEKRPLGIVTERDLVRKACVNDIRTSAINVNEIMSSPIITIDSSSSASEAVDMMVQKNVRHLLVVDKKNNNNINKPVGIITPLDLRDEEYTDEGLKNAIQELSAYYR